MSTAVAPDAFSRHDHRHCQRDALAAAETACNRSGARLTPIRRRVLELIWSSHEPLGAYVLLDRLAGDGRRPAPPTVYRALDFLVQQGLVHRIDSLNAFVGCPHPGESHRTLFLICRRCHRAQELPATTIARTVATEAGELGFEPEKMTLEVVGLCRHCAGHA
ncbi:MAG: Fur family transcriptional regulator [Pseudomonadota bacterium]